FIFFVLFCGCAVRQANYKPSIEVTRIPQADIGGRPVLETITGRVTGASVEHQVVLFARSGAWYVQPFADQPFTKIQADSTWSNSTHLGTDYAALLVAPGYFPPAVTFQLPNEGGAVLAVTTVDGTPPFWRTWWFRLLLALLGIFALVTLYRWRLHELSRQLNLRFEERLAERTRIAQDLHDTLLQGMVSASMQLHVANENIPDNSPAKPHVGRVMELMRQVIDEGRDAVRGLRSRYSNSDDLGTAFAQIGEELPQDGKRDYSVIVDGTPQQLHPIIRDEAYRIGREALVNAFRHSQGSKIEVELEYVAKHLRILIRDNGAGIDPNVLQSGRDGHWGLTGMRERAESIGGRLKVWSRAHAGTEVELLIPSHVAFVSQSRKRAKKWFHKSEPIVPIANKQNAVK
ncbi:MAG TPA: sensor histidine kinase, partial [Pyrinomonadaceae bacterium]|nr:sensor histidine kinase [Pyrinomonadaceae bacterium]